MKVFFFFFSFEGMAAPMVFWGWQALSHVLRRLCLPRSRTELLFRYMVNLHDIGTGGSY